MKPNPIRKKLRDGHAVLGTFVMEFATPGIPAILESAGAEFVVFDMEHSGFGTETIRQLLAYSRGLDIVPMVRVPDTQYDFIARALDAGAKGLMVPMVESREQAEEIVACAKYPPWGRRGATANIAHDHFRGGDLAAKLASANQEILILAQIETTRGVENIEEILAVEGIDIAWVGHNDLSVSMGIPGQVTHHRVVEAMEEVARACQRHQKHAGRLVPDLQSGIEWLNKGYRCLAYGNDIRLLQGALQSGLKSLRNASGGQSATHSS